MIKCRKGDRIKKLVADFSLDNKVLKGFYLKKLVKSADKNRAAYKAIEDHSVIEKMIEIGSEFNRFGYRRIHIMLKRDGNKMNHKRVYHLYKSINLELRKTV